jgi:glycosyltransferase involved in cell wall biosynthesis
MNTERTPQTPPLIKPFPLGQQRPLWSVMIPTYNCSTYLKQTIESVLAEAKDIAEMQIMVIDDHSTDDNVEALVKSVGKGRVEFFRQPQNVGSLRNFETCMNLSRGKLLHILHGDDLVKPGFYSKMDELFTNHPEIGAAITGISEMDENNNLLDTLHLIQAHEGVIDDWLIKAAKKQYLQVCGTVVKRSVYEELGGFFAVHYGEDWEMWVRIASRFPVAYTPLNLALYRVHSNNISSRFLATGQNIKDIETVINIIQSYVPEDRRYEVKKISSSNFARYFSMNAHNVYRVSKSRSVALKQAHLAFRLHANKVTLTSLLKLYVKILIRY